MFSFLKFHKKISKATLFGDGLHFLEEFYQSPLLKKSKWVSLAINKKSLAGSILTKELDIHTENEIFSLKVAETKKGYLHKLWKNQHLKGKKLITSQSPFLNEYNRLIDYKINNEIKYFQNELIKDTTTNPSSNADISQNEKGLEWMRVSFKILEKAILETLTNSQFLFQATLFLGENPKTKNREIRLIIFNLDVQFILLKYGFLRVKIFNDKEGVFGNSKKAALEGDFNFRKKEMLDQLIQLIAISSSGLKLF